MKNIISDYSKSGRTLAFLGMAIVSVTIYPLATLSCPCEYVSVQESGCGQDELQGANDTGCLICQKVDYTLFVDHAEAGSDECHETKTSQCGTQMLCGDFFGTCPSWGWKVDLATGACKSLGTTCGGGKIVTEMDCTGGCP